ncbi:3-oxoacyl-[acyl-carrier-protein] synthase III C-terminal domain-containing protein [Nisaea sediminum]|uniref:3-oxoacyl-[acyl-carrier-protein] synthase III C-terminal domain-containing protein n=1 Tax=Nisaea sediminum TaxID=2775867 RepID=UPI0018674571|nr:3-oxoacyl-[acyl-carrier-protein] synthase III C-terminal domain-containing protein [Nisaea sediminum]
MPFVLSVGVSLPDYSASNSYVKNLSFCLSANHWAGNSQKLPELIDDFFAKSGARERLWRNANTEPKKYLKTAIENCLASSLPDAREKLSSIIFCSVDKGLVEPAHASAFAAQMGLFGVRAFDVSDACLGWFTACEAAQAFASAERPLALIISAEFPLDDPGKVLPEAFTIRDECEFEWKSAALTLGEMATATLIDAFRGVSSCTVKSENQHNQLCVVPIKKPERFIDWTQDSDALDRECFIANGAKLANAGFRGGISVLRSQINKSGLPDVILPHAFSESVTYAAAKKLGLADKVHNVFARVGNISTSSIPFGLWSLAQIGNLRGKNILGWVASAGMKHAAFRLHWIGS